MNGVLIGIGTVIVLIISFSCFIVGASSENIELLTFGLGCWFTFPSLFAVRKVKVAIPFLLVGIALIGYSALSFLDVQEALSFIEENFLVVFGAVFFLVGASLFWFTIGIRLWKRRWCTMPIDVKIESTVYNTMDNHNTEVGYSIYKYYYNGKEYTCDSGGYNNVMLHGEGRYFVAYINPLKPEEIVIPLIPSRRTIIFVLSTISMIVGIGVIILCLTK